MINLQEFMASCLSIVQGLIPIYLTVYLYFQLKTSFWIVNPILFFTQFILLLIRLIVNIRRRLLNWQDHICHKVNIICVHCHLIIIMILLSQQIMMIIAYDYDLKIITWVNLTLSFSVIAYLNVNIYKLLNLSKNTRLSILNVIILVLMIDEILLIIIIQMFLIILDKHSHYHCQNFFINILTLIISYYILVKINIRIKNQIKFLIILQYMCNIYEIILLLNDNSLFQKLHALTVLLNLYNLYYLYNNSYCQARGTLAQEVDNQLIQEPSKCSYCKQNLINQDVIFYKQVSLNISYFTSCAHLFHTSCVASDKKCEKKTCAQPLIRLYQQDLQKYHYQVDYLKINNHFNNNLKKHQYDKYNILLMLIIIIQMTHLLWLPFISYLPYDQSLFFALYVLPTFIIVIASFIFKKFIHNEKFSKLVISLFEIILIFSLIIKYLILQINIIDSRLAYLLLLDFNNFIIMILVEDDFYQIINISLADLLYNQSETRILLLNLVASIYVMIISSTKLFYTVINMMLLMVAVTLLKFRNLCKSSNQEEFSVLDNVMTYLMNGCLIIFYLQIDNIFQCLNRNSLFFIWFTIFMVFFSIKINLKSSRTADSLRYEEMSQIYDLEKILYRGFQLETPFLCWQCGEIQKENQQFIFFITCQHTFHKTCLKNINFDYQNLQKDNIKCRVCSKINRFQNINEQILILQLN